MNRLSALIITVLLSSACLLSGCDEEPAYASLFDTNAESVTVYTATGEILAQYHDCEAVHISSGVVQIDENKGKVYVYYNCYVEVVRSSEWKSR